MFELNQQLPKREKAKIKNRSHGMSIVKCEVMVKSRKILEHFGTFFYVKR